MADLPPKTARMTAEGARDLVAREEDGADCDAFLSMTDEEIDPQIAGDPDAAPEADAAWFAAAARSAAPRAAARRQAIAFEVDPGVMAFHKQGGPGYQTQMHAVLRVSGRHQRPAGR